MQILPDTMINNNILPMYSSHDNTFNSYSSIQIQISLILTCIINISSYMSHIVHIHTIFIEMQIQSKVYRHKIQTAHETLLFTIVFKRDTLMSIIMPII